MTLKNTLTLSLTSLALLAGATALRGEPEAAPGSAARMRLIVDVSDRQLHVLDGDEVTRSYPVAVGKSGHPTPRGQFGIRQVIWNPRWVPPEEEWAKDKTPKAPGDPENPMGKVKMFFQPPDFYIHGTNDEGSLGRAASHGCIRMANSDIVSLARLVMEQGGQAKEPSWFERILNRVRKSQTVRLSTPVPIQIRS